jgi:hypothetical protein
MMGPEYFTAAGYLTDGDALCIACGEKQKLPVSDQITVATAESDFYPDGLSCGNCGATIVEPSFEDEYDDDIDPADFDELDGNGDDGGDLETD